MHLDCLKSTEGYRGGNRSFDPVEADSLVQSSLEALSLKHVDQCPPHRGVDVIHACYSCKVHMKLFVQHAIITASALITSPTEGDGRLFSPVLYI